MTSSSHMNDTAHNFGKQGLCVRVRNNDIDKAMSELRYLQHQERWLQDITRHDYYKSKGLICREKKQKAIRTECKRKFLLLEDKGF